MRHNEISSICRQVVASTLGISENDIEIVPWDEIIYDFAVEHASRGDMNAQQIRVEFQSRVDQMFSEQREENMASKARRAKEMQKILIWIGVAGIAFGWGSFTFFGFKVFSLFVDKTIAFGWAAGFSSALVISNISVALLLMADGRTKED